jgi:hypothetical protein
MRLSGGDPTMRDGLRIAVQHFGKIAGWAFIAATVGVILDTLKNGSNKLIGRLIAGGLGLAWTLITYLIVPIIILEDRTIYDSMERSAELFRKRWGEQIAGSFGFGLLNLLLLLPALAIGFLLFQLDPVHHCGYLVYPHPCRYQFGREGNLHRRSVSVCQHGRTPERLLGPPD